MPSGTSMGIGEGLARGTRSFLNSFYQAKAFELQEKQAQNGVVIQALMHHLEDDNIPLFERAKILDEIPRLAGAKLERPLSQMLGVDEANKHLEEDPNQPAIPSKPGKSGYLLDYNATGSPNEGQTLELKGTQDTNAVPAGMTQRGNLTANDLKLKLVRAQKKLEDAGDIEKAQKIAQIQFDLQEKSYKANGYKITSEGMDSNGEYVQILTNNSGDTKVNRMPKGYKPTKLLVAETQINKPSNFIKEREDYWESKGFSTEEANQKALQDANDKYLLKKKTGEAYAKSVEMGNTGTKPPTAAAKLANEDRDETRRIQLQTAYNNAEQNAIKSSEHAASQAVISQQFYDNTVLPLKNQMDAAYKEADGDTTDTDFLKAQKAYNIANSQWLNGPKKLADLADATDKQHKAALENARNMLGGKSASTIDPKLKAAIDIVRKNNPDKTANMSDEDIANYLRSKGKIK